MFKQLSFQVFVYTAYIYEVLETEVLLFCSELIKQKDTDKYLQCFPSSLSLSGHVQRKKKKVVQTRSRMQQNSTSDYPSQCKGGNGTGETFLTPAPVYFN